MRYFHGMLFYGWGKESEKLDKQLKKRFKEARSRASGLQQDVEVHSPFYKRETKEIEDAIRDIAAALLGRKIKFTDDLSYPPIPQNGEACDS